MFQSPFMRFWFAFVSPYFHSILDDDYDEIQEQFTNRKDEFMHYVFEQLCTVFLQESFQDDAISKIGSYWNKNAGLDIVAKTASGKSVVATCRYTNTKLKKNILNQLMQESHALGFEADIYVLFAKKGFSSELKSAQNENLRLVALRHFKNLLS